MHRALRRVFVAEGDMMKRAPRKNIAQRDGGEHYFMDVPEARRLTEATKAQTIYYRQEEVKGSKTAREQRMIEE